MKPATISEIQKELSLLSQKELLALCSRLLRFKKENKELVTYLLFDSIDQDGFVRKVNESVTSSFAEMNDSNVYLIKKSVRKILRGINKYIRFCGDTKMELEMRIHFCKELKQFKKEINSSQQLANIYNGQIDKIHKAIATLHEDLQGDFVQEVELLEI